MVDAIFFDCDGVLVDTEPVHYRAFLEVLQPYGIYFDYSLYEEKYIGFDDRDAFIEIFKRAMKPLSSKELKDLITLKNKALKRAVSRELKVFDGVVEFIKALDQAKTPMAVVSGSLRDEIELFLKSAGIINFFRFIVAADDVSRSKPDPQSYETAFVKMEAVLGKRLERHRCIVFEDTPSGIASAKGAGLTVVAVAHTLPVAELADADIVIESFKNFYPRDLMKAIKHISKETGNVV
ncbi:MAG TPA: HAD family phosphatase [Thermodesulforhabdus norvegica]|uniref:HAD family phosphatase n=1 Tax=Thermodesulforhabdus norvegica TaxID=39841 RepID=A0A7C0WRI9_9BACT|nr:HAD family phosphatase [Thermodesulforhabdus norvegica]